MSLRDWIRSDTAGRHLTREMLDDFFERGRRRLRGAEPRLTLEEAQEQLWAAQNAQLDGLNLVNNAIRLLEACPKCGAALIDHEGFTDDKCPVVRFTGPVTAHNWATNDVSNWTYWDLSGKTEASEPPRSTNETRSDDGADAQETR